MNINQLYIIKQFYKGRVVIERLAPEVLNPGHVVGFATDSTNKVNIQVEFANGDRYNVAPEDLHAL